MSAAATPIREQLSPWQAWKYELMLANFYAPLDVTCECDAQEYAYKMAFEAILQSGKLNKYDTKKWFQDGIVEDSYFCSEESPDVNPEIYQLLLSNSVEDAQKFELMLNIAWWKAAREKSIENVDGGTEDDFDDQPQIGFSFRRGFSCQI